jgi:type IV secretory pathway TrbF-like protein
MSEPGGMTQTADPTHQNGGLTSHELARLNTWYQVISQRDGAAERRVWHWQMIAAALVVIVFAVGIWDHLDRRTDVQAFVQTVQVNEDGKVLNLGVPVDLIAYEPQDAQWLDMLSEWVRRVRWRGSDEVQAKLDWNWARAHLCGGPVMRLMDEVEKHETPFDGLGKELVSVEIKAATATAAPKTYHVFWEETTTAYTQQRRHQFTGTFTVGRLRPATQAILMQNRLGLCITAFNLSPASGEPQK